MLNLSRILLYFTLIIGLMACGQKQAPQPISSHSEPHVSQVQHIISGNSLRIEFTISGGNGMVGYQIDRAEIDPYCDCPNFWRRWYEEAPQDKYVNQTMSRMINLRDGKVGYAFRVRAVDGLGRLSPWSQIIRARSQIEAE